MKWIDEPALDRNISIEEEWEGWGIRTKIVQRYVLWSESIHTIECWFKPSLVYIYSSLDSWNNQPRSFYSLISSTDEGSISWINSNHNNLISVDDRMIFNWTENITRTIMITETWVELTKESWTANIYLSVLCIE